MTHYCFTCGTRCDISVHIWAYDEATGRPITYETYHCPNKRWYSFGHTEEEIIDRPMY